MLTTEDRQAYYCSREWGLKKEEVKRRSGGLCERCRQHNAEAVHHKTYARLYNEELTDLWHLCRGCHDYVHGRSDVEPAKREMRVYLAGAIFDEGDREIIPDENNKEVICTPCPKVTDWRYEIFGLMDHSSNYSIADQAPPLKWKNYEFIYAGPQIIESHGLYCDEGLPADCIQRVRSSDALFAWIDREDTIGTLVEIGAAYARRLDIFIAFKTEELQRHFYFVDRLSSSRGELHYQGVVAPSAAEAWRQFLTTLMFVVDR